VNPPLDFRFLESSVGIERGLTARGPLATMRRRGARERNQTFFDDHSMDSALQSQAVTA
jgi:hypothetical protein